MQEITIEALHHYFLQTTGVCTDTRNINEQSLFVALKGDNFDGNQFVVQAIKSGAKYAITDNANFANNKQIFYVKDTLIALQNLANYHRKQFSIPVIAITGSNGKTTTKELFNAILSKKYNTLATKGNLNNHIGVPLTLLQLNAAHEVAIIEMGANHQGEIELLSHIAEPTIGLITNIGKAHLEGFGGIEGVIKGKTELYQFLQKQNGLIVYNADNAILKDKVNHHATLCYGFNNEADCVGAIEKEQPFLHLNYRYKNEIPICVNSNLIGLYNAENILSAICVAKYLEVDDQAIIEGIAAYAPDNSRSQIIKKETNTIILDAYNANPSSMKAALDNFSKIDARNKLVILGDMFELGETSAEEHQHIAQAAIQNKANQCIFVGPQFSQTEAAQSQQSFLNVPDCMQYLKTLPLNERTILIKGSRGMKMEQILTVFDAEKY
jgi:UDP-N-acetylmuramoyl-tripeptide--D-alanyl-D-alanine ligase